MTDLLHVKIKIGPTSPGCTIEIDGEDMSKHITGFQVSGDIHQPTTVQLTFVNVEVEIDGMVDLSSMGSEWATYRLGRIIRDELQEGVAAHD